MAIFKPRATGVYLLEEDVSQITNVTPPDGARMLVISSEKGPVNRPILVNDYDEYSSIFDPISRRAERKNNFSARSAFHALAVSPIYVINLRDFDDTLDQAGQIDLSTDTAYDNGVEELTPYEDFFNKNQFWVVDKDKMQDITNAEQLLVFGNLYNKKLSIFVRKTTTVPSRLTFNEWYTNLGRTMPDFVNGNDFVKDWYVDVLVFENDFSDNSINSSNPNYGFLFDENGLKKTVLNASGNEVDGLSQLATITEARFVQTYTGSLIPGFVTENGTNADVVSLINADINTTGLLATLNEHILDTAADWIPLIDDPTDPNYYANDNAKKAIPIDLICHNLCHINASSAFDEDGYMQNGTADDANVKQVSYDYDLVVGEITQTVDEETTSTDFVFDTDEKRTLDKITNALLPGTETEDLMNEYDYSVDTSVYAAGTAMYLFDSTSANVGDKFVSKDGNLATVSQSNFVGSKQYLVGFNTIDFPIMAKATSTFDNGTEGFITGTSLDPTLDSNFITDANTYSSGVGAISAGVGSTGTNLVVSDTTGLNVGDVLGYVISEGGVEYNTIAVVVDGTNLTLDNAIIGTVADTNAVYIANQTTTDNENFFTATTDGSFIVVNSTDSSTTSISVTTSEQVGVFTGGVIAKIPVTVYDTYSYSAANEYVPFPVDVTSGLYVYPTDHILAGQPVVGDSVSRKPVQNPSVGTVYAYQKNGDGSDATITFPVAYNPGSEELVDKDGITIDIIEAYSPTKAATVRSEATTENVFLVVFDKPLVTNKASVPNTLGDLTTQHSVTVDESYHLILNDGTDIVVFNNDLSVFKVYDSQRNTNYYSSIVLNAYQKRREQFPDGTATRQNEILDVMLQDSMKKSLCNRDLISYQYLVDTFGTYIEPNMKYQFTTISSSRQTCAAICNLPSMKDMENSTNPYFSQTIGGDFDPTYLAEGGNLQLPYTNTATLPTNGDTFGYYFGPNLIVNDGGQDFLYPPAAVVSNNYAQKYLGGNVYDVIIGPDTGGISATGVAGVEYAFSQSNTGDGELDVLQPWGYNAIVNKRATGLQIYGNQTAQNRVTTALSKAHAREIIINIQLQIIDMLEPYIGKYNTPQNRLEIQTKADGITAPYVDSGAVISAVNVCDETNNTTEIIDASQAVLDTTLVINNPMEVIVYRTTVDNVSSTVNFDTV